MSTKLEEIKSAESVESAAKTEKVKNSADAGKIIETEKPETAAMKIEKSRLRYEQLASYIERQQQKLLRRYSLRQLADHFTDSDDGDAATLSENFVSVGLDYAPAEFRLTDLKIALSNDRREIVYQIKFQHAGAENDLILRDATHSDRRYTLCSVVQDIYSGLLGAIDDLLAGE